MFSPYAGNAAGGNPIPPQNFQYGQPMPMYNGGGQQQFAYQQQPPFGMHSQSHQQQQGFGSPQPSSDPDHQHGY